MVAEGIAVKTTLEQRPVLQTKHAEYLPWSLNAAIMNPVVMNPAYSTAVVVSCTDHPVQFRCG